MIVVDGHVSHVNNEFIKFTQRNKIVCPCLLVHLTHLLQPLGVDLFDPLKRNYKTLLAEETRFITCNIDKANFILPYRKLGNKISLSTKYD